MAGIFLHGGTCMVDGSVYMRSTGKWQAHDWCFLVRDRSAGQPTDLGA